MKMIFTVLARIASPSTAYRLRSYSEHPNCGRCQQPVTGEPDPVDHGDVLAPRGAQRFAAAGPFLAPWCGPDDGATVPASGAPARTERIRLAKVNTEASPTWPRSSVSAASRRSPCSRVAGHCRQAARWARRTSCAGRRRSGRSPMGQGLLGATLILLAACSLATARGVQSARLAGVSLSAFGTGPLSCTARSRRETLLSVQLAWRCCCSWSGSGTPPRHFPGSPQDGADGGRSADDRVAPPLILLLMWLGQPGQSAALLGMRDVVHGAGQPTTGRPGEAHRPATDAVPSPCWSFRTWPACPCWPCWRFPGARRVAEDRAWCRSSICGAAVRGSGPRLAPFCCMACWAGRHGGATRNRSCSSPCARWRLPPPLRTRSAYPPPWSSSPGWCWARATSGTTWKATSGRFAMCCRACSS